MIKDYKTGVAVVQANPNVKFIVAYKVKYRKEAAQSSRARIFYPRTSSIPSLLYNQLQHARTCDFIAHFQFLATRDAHDSQCTKSNASYLHTYAAIILMNKHNVE